MSRYRRLRQNTNVRALVRETILTPNDVIQPFFIVEGQNIKEPILSMPGIYRYSLDTLKEALETYQAVGGKAGLFFGIPACKDAKASQAFAPQGVIPTAIQQIKKWFPDFIVITDVCLCAYTDHGHCGVLTHQGIVDNDATIEILGQMALSHAKAGADIVAPSDMMDLRVSRIRADLDAAELTNVSIMSYAVKYASAFYGPFRDAADCAPSCGDRKTYQMDAANTREALKEAAQDIREGADFIMVKPALAYLDIVHQLHAAHNVPIIAYNVSGEYAMVKAAAEKGWIDEKAIVLESLTSMKRAGADIILTYHAQDTLTWMAN